MVLINKTKSVVLHENVIEAKTFKAKQEGLIGSDGKTALLLKTRYGLHTFDMKFPIDIAVLGSENTIVKIKRNLKPNRFFFWHPKYSKVIEIPSILNAEFAKGDILVLS